LIALAPEGTERWRNTKAERLSTGPTIGRDGRLYLRTDPKTGIRDRSLG
jgi:hypothetical protein